VLVSPQLRAGRAKRAWLLSLVAGALAGGCGKAPPERVLDLESHLSRQVADLRTLVERAEKGRLVPSDGLVVAVREDVVRRMAELALPRDEIVQGRFRVRLERADVRFRDRHGAVRLEGRVGWADDADLYQADVFVDLTVFGRIEAAAVDAKEGTLTVEVVPIGFEIRRVNVGGGQPSVRQLAEGVARALPEGLSALRSTVTIPVAFERELRLAGRESGPLRFRPASLPLRMVVQDASAHGGRLWVSIAVEAPSGKAGARR
jgi:hypothetical protein